MTPKVEYHADARATQFTQENFVFDCLGLFYVLSEPYATRCLEAGVYACNVTYALENSWDDRRTGNSPSFQAPRVRR